MFLRRLHWFFCFVIHIVIVRTALVCESAFDHKKEEKHCSCRIAEGIAIDLCPLSGDYCHVLSRSSDESTGIKMSRFYILNLFRKIKSSDKGRANSVQKTVCKKDISKTNCPSKSMCCLASIVTSECQTGSVCFDAQVTADSYGYFNDNWKIRLPLTSDGSNFKEATAVIEMKAGACYFCQKPKDNIVNTWLNTVVGLFCDERVTDKGRPVVHSFPKNGNAKLVFNLATSQSCYTFNPKETCLMKQSNICKDKTFSCNSQNYNFSFPIFANHSISFRTPLSTATSTYTEYEFGFCAQDVQECSTTKNVMICKKIMNGSQVVRAIPVAFYNDNDHEVVIRPTGFVWRLNQEGRLTAVVSFQCEPDQSTADRNFHMKVQDKKLPVLVTLKHRCFCPNPPVECAGGSAPTAHSYHKPTPKPITKIAIIIIMSVFCCCFIGVVVLVWRFKRNPRVDTPPASTPETTTTDGQTTTGQRGPSPAPSSNPSSYHSALSSPLCTRKSSTSTTHNTADSTALSETTPLLKAQTNVANIVLPNKETSM